MLLIYHETAPHIYEHDEEENVEPHEHWHILETNIWQDVLWASDYDMGYHSPEEARKYVRSSSHE